MAKKNLRRIEVSTSEPGISNNFIDLQFLNDAMVNFHGYHCQFDIEPTTGDANYNGIWAVWVLPNDTIQNSDLPTTYGEFGNEDRSAYLWGMGTLSGSNQNPSHTEFAPKSTRNMQRNSRIVLQILVQGLSIGVVRLNTVQTGFVTQVT